MRLSRSIHMERAARRQLGGNRRHRIRLYPPPSSRALLRQSPLCCSAPQRECALPRTVHRTYTLSSLPRGALGDAFHTLSPSLSLPLHTYIHTLYSGNGVGRAWNERTTCAARPTRPVPQRQSLSCRRHLVVDHMHVVGLDWERGRGNQPRARARSLSFSLSLP